MQNSIQSRYARYILVGIMATSLLWLTSCTDENIDAPNAESNDVDTSQNDTTDRASSTDGSTDQTDTDSESSTDTTNLEWQNANLTWYTSYPDEGSSECLEYNGCQWAGWFAGLDEQMSAEWVASHNIASVHSDYFSTYNGKTLRLRDNNDHQIDVVVYDMCADSDCNNCCTNNMRATGFLIDLEINTADRFGVYDGIVEFTCLDCSE